MSPLNLPIEAWSDADFTEVLECTTNGGPTDFSLWTELEFLAADKLSATEASLTGQATASPGQILLHLAQADLAAALPPGANTKTFFYVLRGKPVGTYRARVIHGMLTLNRGLPPV